MIVKNPTYVKVEVPAPSKFTQFMNGTLTTVTEEDLAGATEIRPYMFYNQPLLQKVYLPNSVGVIGANAFYNCKKLQQAFILSPTVSIGNNAFQHSEITKLIAYGVATKQTNGYCFSDCNKLSYVEFNEGFTTVDSLTTYGTVIKTLVLPSTTNTLHGNWSQNFSIVKLVCKSLVPPRMASLGGTNGTNYVPYESIETYKNATNWSSYPRFYPLVNSIDDLSTIDTSKYVKACINDRENEYPIYNYTNGEWVKEA